MQSPEPKPENPDQKPKITFHEYCFKAMGLTSVSWLTQLMLETPQRTSQKLLITTSSGLWALYAWEQNKDHKTKGPQNSNIVVVWVTLEK